MIIATDGGVKWTAEAFAMNTKKGKIMTDYIKREDAMEASTPAFRNAFSDWEVGWIESKDDTKDMIEDLPSADVAPVRHGRWFQDAIFYGEDGSPCIVDICTECRAYGDYADFKYCPNCGAKMDEGDTDEIDRR